VVGVTTAAAVAASAVFSDATAATAAADNDEDDDIEALGSFLRLRLALRRPSYNTALIPL
jgi:hypothetical protein